MPISSLALSRTVRPFTDHLKNFELGTITETNPSDGVYRYTFADGTSPYTWGEVASAQAGIASNGIFGKFGINVGHTQMDATTGAYDIYTSNTNFLHIWPDEPYIDSLALVSGVQTKLPSGRNTETTGSFASFLGGNAVTVGGHSAYAYGPSTTRIQTNTPVTVNTTNRYVEINWNQVALNETTHTTPQRNYGRTVAGKVKIAFQPFLHFDTLNGDYTVNQGYYYGKPRYYNSTIAGANLATLRSSPPADITVFNYPGGRTIGWTETNTNYGNPYIYAYRWNGSSWDLLRQGFISDGQLANDGRANFNTYTFPAGDGTSTYFYIYIYQYDGYYNTFSGTGAGSNFIAV